MTDFTTLPNLKAPRKPKAKSDKPRKPRETQIEVVTQTMWQTQIDHLAMLKGAKVQIEQVSLAAFADFKNADNATDERTAFAMATKADVARKEAERQVEVTTGAMLRRSRKLILALSLEQKAELFEAVKSFFPTADVASEFWANSQDDD